MRAMDDTDDARDHASAPGDTIGAQPDESPKERVDRELSELLEETRVILPAVELLFGFLILLPFSQGFAEVSGLERALYLVTLGSTALALGLLLATPAHHRLGFRRVDKERLLLSANRLIIAATVLVAVSVASAVYLAVETVVGGGPAGLIAMVYAGILAWLWFGLPVLRRMRDRPD